MNLLIKTNYYKVIFFTLLILTLASPSTAETISGSPTELINGSGSFTWTSQNFPALRDGDTLTLNVVNNTLAGLNSVVNSEEPLAIGLAYKMKKLSFYEVLAENFPSVNINADDSYKGCINYLTNYYCYAGYDVQYNEIVIDKKPYRVHVGDELIVDSGMKIIITDIIKDESIPPKNFIYYHYYYLSSKSGDGLISEGSLFPIFSFQSDESAGTGKSRLLINTKEIDADDGIADFQGLVEIFRDDYIIPPEFGNLMICSQCNEDWRDYEMFSNNGDITLTEGINDLSDELKIVKNGNSIYPSANIVKRTLNVKYIPAPIPEPTVEVTVAPTVEATVEVTAAPTVEATVAPTQIEWEVKDLKEPFNKTEDKQSQQDEKMSLKSIIDSIINWLKSIF